MVSNEFYHPTDEFSSQGSEKDFNGSLIISECASTTPTNNNPSVGTCRALYQYAANLYDELNLNPGILHNVAYYIAFDN